MYPRKRGFSLVEVLIAVAIIGILISILVPSVARYRSSADTAKCSQNLRSLVQANLLYAADHSNRLPPLFIPPAGDNRSWASDLAPYLGSDRLTIGASSVYKWDGQEGQAAWKEGARSAFSCPNAAARTRPVPIITPSYARNIRVRDPETFEWEAAPALSMATHPARTIFLTDSNVSKSGEYAFASAYVDENSIARISPTHPNHQINIAWLDGHITNNQVSEFASSPYLPGMEQDVWSLIK